MAGHRYERKVIAALKREPYGKFHYHQWVRFTDLAGVGGCEPEGYWVFEHEVVLVECKLTAHPHCWDQVEGLYKPLLERLYARPVRCVIIARTLTPHTIPPFFDDIHHFIHSSAPRGTIHWTL